MVSVSTRTDLSHRLLYVTLKVEFTKIDLGYLDGEEAEMLADEFPPGIVTGKQIGRAHV